MKLINFKHLDQTFADQMSKELMPMVVNIGTISVALNEFTNTAWFSSFIPNYNPNISICEQLTTDQLMELEDIILIMHTVFCIASSSIYWCFKCKHVSTTAKCSCGECKGIEDINWG